MYGPSRGRLNTGESRDNSGRVFIGAWAAASIDDKQFIQTFSGNQDENTAVTNQFQSSVIAKCVRINPLAWNHHIALRLELLGCPVLAITTSPPSSTSTMMSTVAATRPQSSLISTTISFSPPNNTQTSITLKANPPAVTTNKAKLTATPVCENQLVTGPFGVSDGQLSASSERNKNNSKEDYSAKRGRLQTLETKDNNGNTLMGAWSAETINNNQYLQVCIIIYKTKFQQIFKIYLKQVELNKPSLIRGVITQGRNGCCQEWVTKYRVLYSIDCQTWHVLGGIGKVFNGNSDENTLSTSMFSCPITAKCVRINPINWNNHISMRLDLVGCPIKTSLATNLPQKMMTY
ncbi:hypothetical protein KUTeg_002454 [Tegillarca granosa]|uniref:F5/8 type C domain-containing protein n=1 Tax=Tegillarca granosa TaxID=220873 RepID=A0ABQ9FVP4_TEGGR|nr:hypothetical protein KUTeg_002454 [Tegillarca granosa]